MNLLSKLAAPAAFLLATTLPAFASGISASATYTAAPDPVIAGVYNYSLTLNNTGTTNIGEFWFAWIPGAGFLSAVPSKVGSPTGWNPTQTNAGAAIQWIDAGTPLAAGQSLTGFTFSSSETQAQLLLPYAGTGTGAGSAQTTSYVYIVTRVATDPGFTFAASPSVAATPEPGSLLLALSGVAAAGALACGAECVPRHSRRPQPLSLEDPSRAGSSSPILPLAGPRSCVSRTDESGCLLVLPRTTHPVTHLRIDRYDQLHRPHAF